MEGLQNGWGRVLLQSYCYKHQRGKWRHRVGLKFYPVGKAWHSTLPSSSSSRTSLRGGSEEFIARRKKGKGIAIAAIIITVLLPSFPPSLGADCSADWLADERPLAAAPVKAKAAPNGGNFGDGRTEGGRDGRAE